MTDRYAVIGNPVSHSKSPWIHAEFARETMQDIDYGRIEAPLDAFARTVDAFRAAGGRGANVTLPFKEEAHRYCTEKTPRADAAGAVNTMRFDAGSALGDNTDGVGLVRDLEANLGVALRGKSLLVLGAGGAARGVIGPLLEAGVRRVVIANRTAEKALALARRFSALASASGGVEGCGYVDLRDEAFDLVINATSAGLAGERPPVDERVFAQNALAYEMVYGRGTPFLAFARGAGVRTADGLGMLVEQAAESFLLWRGVRPATRPVRMALGTD